MMLVEDNLVPDAALPVDRIKAHLRLGTGFAEDGLQDAMLASFLRAALAAIEARTGKALVARDFVLTLQSWDNDAGQSLSIAPVIALHSVAMVDASGNIAPLDGNNFRLVPDADAPILRPKTGHLPYIADSARVEIRFRAGFGDAFADMPADLQQAALLLAAHYYEYRDETDLSDGCMPFGVTSLISRYRVMRLGARL